MILKNDDFRFRNLDMLDFDIFPVTHDKDYKLLIIVFRNDACQTNPHFHVVDFKTCGNRINAAYDLKTGRYMLHGSVIRPLSNKNLQIIQKILKTKPKDSIYTIWQLIQNTWKGYNTNDFSGEPNLPLPTLSNQPIAITHQYTRRKSYK